MRWFQHSLKPSPEVEQFIDMHGLYGYGMYMRLLEIVAENIDTSPNALDTHGYFHHSYYKNNYAFLVKKLKITDRKQFDDVVKSLIEFGLFEEVDGKLYCHKIKGCLDIDSSTTTYSGT